MAELKVVLSADTKKATDDLQKVSATIKDVDKSAQSLKSLDAILKAIEKNTIATSNGFKELADNLKKVPEKPPVDPEPIKKFTGTIGVLTERLPRLRDALLNATDPAKIDRLNKIIAETQLRIKSLSSTTLPTLTKSTGGANIALTNFGRVVQDAPFGIIGIANNIDPLISSFQRLKVETGSTRGAFKSLLAGLKGPAGIAIAVSSITSAFIAFGPQIAQFFSTVDLAAQKSKAAAEAFKGAAKDVASEASNVEKLVAVIKSETTTRQAKIAAIKELNSISPTYFGGLRLEGDLVVGLEGSYKNYIANLLQTAKAKAAQSAITDLYAKRLELESKLVGSDLVEANKKAAEATRQLDKARGSVQQLGIGPLLSQEERAALALQNQIQLLDREIAGLASKTIADYNDEAKKSAESATKVANAQKELTAEFRSSLELVQPSLDGLDQRITKEEALARALIARKNAETSADNTATQDAANALVNGAQAPAAIGNIRIPQGIADEQARINKEAAIGAQQFAAIQASVAQTQAIFNTLGPVVDQTFAAIANGENAFDAIGQGVKRLIVDLIKAAAIAAVISGLSGGATSFLGAFKGLVGFARGGAVFGPTPALVGEAGPEAIIPLSQLANIIGNSGGGGNVNVTGTLRGNDLFITNQRGGASYGRLFG